MTTHAKRTGQETTMQAPMKRQPGAARGGPEPAVSRMLLSIVDGGLAGVFLAAPWFMGGRHPLGELVIVVLAVTVAVSWLARQAVTASGTWRWSGAELLLLVSIFIVAAQLAPLPRPVFEWLSPRAAEVLPLWSAAAEPGSEMGVWNQLSLTPDATRGGLVMLAAYCLLFLITLQRVTELADVERLLKHVAVAATLLAAVGLLQYVAGNGKFLWLYQHPFRDTYDVAKGPFINRNHFAHILALGLAPIIWSLQRTLKSRTSGRRQTFGGSSLATWAQQHATLVWSTALALVLFAGLMSLSRGGAAVMALATLLCGGALCRRGLLAHKFALSMLAIFALVGISLFIHGYSRVSERLDDYASGSLDQLDGSAARRKIWAADAAALPDFWRCGSGVGSHREVYPMYFAGSWSTEWTHAENGYLQVALETGLAGTSLLAVGLVWCGWWCKKGLSNASSDGVYVCAAAVAASLAVSAVHSLVDFVWYIPSCMAMTAVLAACCARLSQLSAGSNKGEAGDGRWALHPLAMRFALASTAVIGLWMVYNRFTASMAAPGWDKYLAWSLAADSRSGKACPDDEVIEHLRRVVAWTPHDARAHARLASMCLRRFEHLQKTSANAMSLTQVRDAAIASHFASRGALDSWLQAALGDARKYLDLALRHARAGLACGPLQGEAYVYLAELCFLEGARPETMHAYLAQALLVRPHSGKVLLAAGNEAALAGRLDQAVALWKRSFHSGPVERDQLIEMLVANRVPPEFLLVNFAPDFAALGSMYRAYSRIARPDQIPGLLTRYVQSGHEAVKGLDESARTDVWLGMAKAYEDMRQPKPAMWCLEQAVASRPNEYYVRYRLGCFLLAQHAFVDAEKHLEWCLQRRPNDADLKQALAAVVRERLSSDPQAALPPTAVRR